MAVVVTKVPGHLKAGYKGRLQAGPSLALRCEFERWPGNCMAGAEIIDQ
jgi:hypothetical protein